MRKLATIRGIGVIVPIAGANAIEAAVIGGWKVVIRKGDYQVGDRVIYCEIDSWIPHERAPFLSKGKEPSEYQGIKGERLRTIKLRGQVSQGLLLPMSNLTNYGADLSVGDDVTEQLGILKWEAPVPANLSGDAIGLFPIFIPKTDQERIQNLSREFDKYKEAAELWEITEKLDGSSMTVFFKDADELAASGLRLHAGTAYITSVSDVRLPYPQIEIVDTSAGSSGGAAPAASVKNASAAPAADNEKLDAVANTPRLTGPGARTAKLGTGPNFDEKVTGRRKKS